MVSKININKRRVSRGNQLKYLLEINYFNTKTIKLEQKGLQVLPCLLNRSVSLSF